MRAEGSDRVGLLHEITGILNASKKNLHAVSTGEKANPGTSVVSFIVYVDSVREISSLFSSLRRIKGVSDVRRVPGTGIGSGQA